MDGLILVRDIQRVKHHKSIVTLLTEICLNAERRIHFNHLHKQLKIKMLEDIDENNSKSTQEHRVKTTISSCVSNACSVLPITATCPSYLH